MMHPFMFYACVERKSMCIQITCVYQAPGTTALDASPMPVWRVRLQKAINGTERRWRIRKCAAQQTDIFHKNAQWINIRCTMHVECKYIHVPLFNFHFFCLAVAKSELGALHSAQIHWQMATHSCLVFHFAKINLSRVWWLRGWVPPSQPCAQSK